MKGQRGDHHHYGRVSLGRWLDVWPSTLRLHDTARLGHSNQVEKTRARRKCYSGGILFLDLCIQLSKPDFLFQCQYTFLYCYDRLCASTSFNNTRPRVLAYYHMQVQQAAKPYRWGIDLSRKEMGTTSFGSSSDCRLRYFLSIYF